MPDTPHSRRPIHDELAELGATQWTDYNAHDPGITILEQLDYALSDLAYRASFPVADLLASHGTDPNTDLPGPEQILTTKAVTEVDVHALIVDVDGVLGGWLVPPTGPELTFFHHGDSRELRFVDEAGTDPEPVLLGGLDRVLLRKNEDGVTSVEAVIRSVAGRLHAQRNACTDFGVGAYRPHPVWLHAELEIGPVDEPEALLADIYEVVEELLAPHTIPATLRERREAGARIDEIYAGPLLEHGFVPASEAQPQPGNVRTSDIIHVLLDLPEVRAVRTLTISSSEFGARQRWELPIPDGEAPTLALASDIELLRAGLELGVDRSEAKARYQARRAAISSPVPAEVIEPPRGRDREVQRYRSVQDQFPRAYGVGRFGLPDTAPAARRGQARQLEAFLLLFDQILANEFAQLSHVGDLFRWTGELARSYVPGEVSPEGLRLDELRWPPSRRRDTNQSLSQSQQLQRQPQTHAEWLELAVGVDDSFERKNRFLNHLLARFAEQPVDHALLRAQHADDPAELIHDKREFLRAYVEISSGRGAGHDVVQASSASPLAERIRLRLGLEPSPEQFCMLEHLLLRPVSEDAGQLAAEGEEQVPLLDDVDGRDPYSHQLSFVFRGPDPDEPGLGQAEREYIHLVEQTILDETPAHLCAYLLWLDDRRWASFADAYVDWRRKYAAYRRAKLGATQIDVSPTLHLPMRDARDRLIDTLGFGRSYPLRDLPVPELLIVPPGDSAKITIGFSQSGVRYHLHDARSGAEIPGVAPVEGTSVPPAQKLSGGLLGSLFGGLTSITSLARGRAPQLVSPAIVEDTRYRIRATKIETEADAEPRTTWLHQLVVVEVGLDVTLTARIDAELLAPPQVGEAADSAPRIVFFGEQARVVMPATQEGVSYDLIERLVPPASPTDAWREQLRAARSLSPTVVGTAGQIELITNEGEVALAEDVDLAIRAQKQVGTDANPELKIEQLNIVLPLKVRARRTLAEIGAQLVPSAIVDWGGAATLRLSSSQASASYAAHTRRTYDDAFLFERTRDGADYLFRRLPGGAEEWTPAGPSNAVLDVSVDAKHTVHVVRPPVTHKWQDQPRFQSLGLVPGTGAPLELAIEGLRGETTILIEARKLHVNGPLDDATAMAAPRIVSRVQLEQAALVLVRPNPDSGLKLAAYYDFDAERVRLIAGGGQPGVIYALGDELGAALADRAYFHKRDDYDPAVNKGIGQLRVRGDGDGDLADLTVARTQLDDLQQPATQAPELPLLDTVSALGVDVLDTIGGTQVGVTLAEKVITRVAGPHAPVTVHVDRRDVSVDLLYGIGSVTAGRLVDADLGTVGELADADVSGVTIEKVTSAQLQRWQAAASLLLEFHELSPQQADILAGLGVETVDDAQAKLDQAEGLTDEQVAALEALVNS